MRHSSRTMYYLEWGRVECDLVYNHVRSEIRYSRSMIGRTRLGSSVDWALGTTVLVF